MTSNEHAECFELSWTGLSDYFRGACELFMACLPGLHPNLEDCLKEMEADYGDCVADSCDITMCLETNFFANADCEQVTPDECHDLLECPDF